MRNHKLILVIVSVIIFLAGVFVFIPTWKRSFQVGETKQVEIGGNMVQVELALTPEAQERGLSGRKNLAEGNGMLFVFPKSGKYFFWMQEMNFPIDIIWIDQNFRIIYVQKNVTPESYPETFGPNLESRYVLEVPAGFAEKNNLILGEPAQFLP